MTTFNVSDKVVFKGAMGANEIISIKGNFATTRELNTGFEYRKKLSSLQPYKEPNYQWGEQELADGQAKYNHGATVYSILDNRGTGGVFVWDSVKKEIVRRQDLTQL